MDDFLKFKADPERAKRLQEEAVDRKIADIRKRESTPVIQDSSLSTKDVWKVKGGTDKINTKEIQKQLSGDDFTKKIADIRAAKAASKGLGKKLLGAIPIVGALASAAMSEDASAAIPLLDEAESVGMSAADENQMLNDYNARRNYDKSQARKDALEALLKK